MDTLNTAIALITPDCYCASIDLSDAYYSVRVHPKFRKYLRFEYEQQLYEFTCLPNGLSPGPRIFTKLLKPAFSHLRKNFGITIMGYLDDLFLVDKRPDRLCEAVQETVKLFTKLGFKISVKKSQLDPVQKIEFLGFLIQCDTMSVHMTPYKAQRIIDQCEQMLKKSSVTIRQLAQLTGSMIATLPANPMAKLYSKKLEIIKNQALAAKAGDYEATIKLTSEDKSDLYWWINNIGKAKKQIVTSEPDITIYTDASKEGWGCHIPETGQTTNGRWTLSEQAMHINVLELRAVLYSLQSLLHSKQQVHIRVMTDNTVTMLTLQNQGSTASHSFNIVCREIWLWCCIRNNWLSLAHCPGILNVEADLASRVFNDDTEWSLDKKIFVQICKRFGNPTIDIFASRLNKKVAKYYSWHPDPEAKIVDAFTVPWTFDYIYAFPPFSIIPRFLQKLQADGGGAVLVVPVWPNQAWFTTVLQLAVAPPLVFPVKDRTLTLEHKPDRIHPLAHELYLMAIRLSMNPLFHEAFQEICCTSFRRLGNTHQELSTVAIWPNGNHFVSAGKLIPIDRHYVKV